MKKILLAVATLATLAAAPALAQYPGYRPPPPVDDRYEDHGRDYDRRGPDYDRRGPDYDRRGPDYDRRDPRYGQDNRRGPRQDMRRNSARMCITSRGNCRIGGFAVAGQPCTCVIPGFGEKRGNAR